MAGVVEAPDAVGASPVGAGQTRSAIDAIPIGRIVALEVGKGPGNAEGAEHREVGGGIGLEGVEECAVPIKEDGADIAKRRRHVRKEYQRMESGNTRGARPLGMREVRRQEVVALKRDVVKGEGERLPTLLIGRLEADDVRLSNHADRAAAGHAAYELDFEGHGCAGFQIKWTARKEAAGADVGGVKSLRLGFPAAGDADELQGKTQTRARIGAALIGNGDGVGGYAGHAPRRGEIASDRDRQRQLNCFEDLGSRTTG